MAAIVRNALAKSMSKTTSFKFSTCVVRNGIVGERKEVNRVKRCRSMKEQISKEWDVNKLIQRAVGEECPFIADERFASDVFEVLKTLLKDLKKFNSDNRHKLIKDADFILRKKAMIRDLFKSGDHRRCRYMPQQPLYPIDVDFQIAQRIIFNYNRRQHLNLQFSRVVSVDRNIYPSRRNLVVEAYNPDAARVPIKLEAVYYYVTHKLHKFKASLPVPFMRVKHVGKKAEGHIVEDFDVEPLLFANLKHCPIIKKRLGLKMDENKDKDTDVYELVCGLVSRGQVVKLPKDDDTVNSIASSAVKQQRKRLQLVRVTKACQERISKDQFVYHIMLEAMKAKVKTVYYAAVMTNGGKRKEGKCIDWVTVDSPRATMPLPGLP